MSIAKRQKEASTKPRKPAAKTALQWVHRPLTHTQKAELAIAAKVAHDLQVTHGLTDLSLDDFRRAECAVACGHNSFRDCNQRHYRSIKAHFLTLAGKEDDAAKLWAKTGRVKDSAQLNDTHENRETAIAVIKRMIERSKGRIDMHYVMQIAKDQHQGKELIDITAAGLQALVYTLTNRLRDKGMDMNELS